MRQGHEPDYLMGPGTNMPKFSTCNLTAAGLPDAGFADVNPRGALFVDYPTQAGAFFQWAGSTGFERRAWSPVGETDGWSPGYDKSESWNSALHETSPAGFRRMTEPESVANFTLDSSRMGILCRRLF